MSNVRPIPKFYILRPDGTMTPLIALDQLPPWLWIKGSEWGNPSARPDMVAASGGIVPRDGEYEVVCCNCYSTIDPMHRTTSERTGPAPPPPAPPVPPLVEKLSRSFPGAYCTGPQSEFQMLPFSGGPSLCRLPSLRPPGLDAGIQNPVVGMCLGNFRCPLPSPSGSSSDKPQLNPAAADFNPHSGSTPYAPQSPPSGLPLPTAGNSSFEPVKQEALYGSKSTDAALEQLKHAVGIGSDSDLSASDISDALLGVPFGRRRSRGQKWGPGKIRGRSSCRARTKRLGGRNVSFRQDAQPRQTNSATKRQERRERALRKNQGQSVQRYWHMKARARRSQITQA